MSLTRITGSRRRFIEILKSAPRITFSDLKEALIDTKEMNLATLYRIIDAFRDKGLIHEMTIAGERVIFPCQSEQSSPNDGVMISFCENCGGIYDTHVPLNTPYISSITHAHMKSCHACVIS